MTSSLRERVSDAPSKGMGDQGFTLEDPLTEPSETRFSTKTCFAVMKDGNSDVECPDGTLLLFSAVFLIRVDSSLTP